jgi:hypothetical protein
MRALVVLTACVALWPASVTAAPPKAGVKIFASAPTSAPGGEIYHVWS